MDVMAVMSHPLNVPKRIAATTKVTAKTNIEVTTSAGSLIDSVVDCPV